MSKLTMEEGWEMFREVFFSRNNVYTPEQAAVISKVLKEAFESGFNLGQHEYEPVGVSIDGTGEGTTYTSLGSTA